MGKPRPPEKAILFAGLLYSREERYELSIELLRRFFPEVLFITDPILWEHTEYYREELGWPIYRRFITFKKIIDPSEIVDIKLLTNEIEEELAQNGRRTVNIDPGYVTLSKVVLATTKNYAHRVYLGRGIYAEVTLYYKKGAFRPHEFTYRDYRTDGYIEIFEMMRESLKNLVAST